MLTALFALMLLALLGGGALVFGLLTAREGYEDEAGFHPLRESRRGFNTKLHYSKPLRSRPKLTRMA